MVHTNTLSDSSGDMLSTSFNQTQLSILSLLFLIEALKSERLMMASNSLVDSQGSLTLSTHAQCDELYSLPLSLSFEFYEFYESKVGHTCFDYA